jgi:hypothetical protein
MPNPALSTFVINAGARPRNWPPPKRTNPDACARTRGSRPSSRMWNLEKFQRSNRQRKWGVNPNETPHIMATGLPDPATIRVRRNADRSTTELAAAKLANP